MHGWQKVAHSAITVTGLPTSASMTRLPSAFSSAIWPRSPWIAGRPSDDAAAVVVDGAAGDGRVADEPEHAANRTATIARTRIRRLCLTRPRSAIARPGRLCHTRRHATL